MCVQGTEELLVMLRSINTKKDVVDECTSLPGKLAISSP